MPTSSDITAIDNFCGCGGSTSGLKAAGVRVVHAANHWDKAIESHNTNHPEVDHSCVDLHCADPRYFPRTTIAWMSIECFPKGTLILSEKGLVPIEEIQIGDKVLTHKNRWMPVTNTMKTIKDTLILDGRWCPDLETTAEHPFLIRQRLRRDKFNRGKERPLFSEASWKTVNQLLPGNQKWNRKYWATPILSEPLTVPSIEGVEFTDSFWWMVGRWLGDGSLDIRPNCSIVTICCGRHEADNLETMLELTGFNWKRREVRTAILFDITHQSLALWLLKHFGKLAHGKTVPVWAWTMTESWRKNLLNGYVSADGHTARDSFGAHVSVTTVSKKLSIGVRFLAESLGHPVSVRKYKQHCDEIEGRKLNVKPCYVLRWRSTPVKEHNQTYKFDNHFWGAIRSVKEGRQNVEVYNLSVAEDESYVADGIVVHNCTTYSPAGGKKRKQPDQLHLWEPKVIDPAKERSRMGAWDVVRFSEFHRYQAVIVENVLEFLEWELFDTWLSAMLKLGYDWQCVYLNSQFCTNPVPQSRDRIYIVFHRKGNRKPNLDFRPAGYCQPCGEQVNCIQSWKKPTKRFGRYQQQYIYTCPKCANEVVPFRRPAREAIDWSLSCQKIGDRKKPLSSATLRRIEKGLKRFAFPFISHCGYSKDESNRAYSLEHPCPTQTTRQEMALAVPNPVLMHYGYASMAEDGRSYSIDEPSPTQTTKRKLAIAIPPFFVHRGYSVDQNRILPVDEPAPTQTTSNKLYLAMLDVMRTGSTPLPVDGPSATLCTSNHHALITAYHGGRDAIQSVNEPSYTIATNNQFGLVEPFISSYYGNGGESPVSEPSPTMRTAQGHALIEPDWSALVNECGYRMLQPHEAKRLMGFSEDYVILGNQKEQFKQAGNAVTPPAAADIARRVIESLS